MTVQLAPSPMFQAFGPNGQFLVGGQLFTYAAGTSTPQVTYIDSTQTTVNTNPVILNAMGQASVWLDVTLNYKFVLQDSAGNPIGSQDHITGALALTSLNIGPPASGPVITVNGAATGAGSGDITINTVEGVGLGVLSATAPFCQIFLRNTLNSTTSFCEVALQADNTSNNFNFIMQGSANTGQLTNGPAGGQQGIIGTFGAFPIVFGVNQRAVMYLSAAGNVVIPPPPSGNALSITGTLAVTGNVTASGTWSVTGAAATGALTVTGSATISGALGFNGASPPAQVTGWGTPTGPAVVNNYSGTAATLVQTSNAVAEIITALKALGLFGA